MVLQDAVLLWASVVGWGWGLVCSCEPVHGDEQPWFSPGFTTPCLEGCALQGCCTVQLCV